jgi:hypothetical protein
MAAAAGALGRGRPAAALSAFLRAHDLAPRDAAPLIDAAPLLSQAGRGRAALALLDAAAHLKAPKTQPFGISWKAVRTANRGQALIVTHQFGAAARTLKSALRAAPLLREAEQNMAVAEECAGKKDAQQYFLGAVRRQTFARGDYVERGPDNPFGQLNEAEVLDTSHGQTLTLPTFKYPRTMDEGWIQAQEWLSLEEQNAETDQTAAISKLNAESAALAKQQAKANPATRQRTQDILMAVGAAGLDPKIRALGDKAANLQDEFSRLQLQGYGQGGCINGGLHGQWLSAVQAYDTAQRAYAVALYRRQTAFAANLRNPLAHEVGVDTARHDVVFNEFLLIDAGKLLSGYDRICDKNPPGAGDENPESGQTQTPSSPPCPSGIGGPDFSLNLLVFSFSVTCEDVTVEAEVGEGWLNGFVSVSHNFGKGSNTIYAGAQAGAKVNVGPLTGGATARGGVYVTFGSDGGVQDVGLRGTTSVSAQVGGDAGGSASISGPETSISLVGAFTSPY